MKSLLQRARGKKSTKSTRKKRSKVSSPSRPRPLQFQITQHLRATHDGFGIMHATGDEPKAVVALPDRFAHVRTIFDEGKPDHDEVIDLQTGRPCRAFSSNCNRNQFENEVSVLLDLRGRPNIPSLVDYEDIPRTLIFEGPTFMRLDSFLKTNLASSMTQLHVQHIIKQILQGLQQLHSLGMGHCDLTTHNVMINDACEIILVDFQSVRNFAQPIEDKSLANSGKPLMVNRKRRLTRQRRTQWVRPSFAPPEEILSDLYERDVQTGIATTIVSNWIRKSGVRVCYDVKNMLNTFSALGNGCFPEKKDMWSVGCILANLEMRARGHLFYERLGEEKISRLAAIFQVIGSPSQEQVARLRGKALRECVLAASDFSKQEDRFEQLIPSASKQCLHLMRNLLQFDPDRRLTVSEALAHHFLSGCS